MSSRAVRLTPLNLSRKFCVSASHPAPAVRRSNPPGTHITAVGADTTEKQELDPAILAKADLLVADSVAQCLVRGECPHALRAGLIRQEQMVELGRVIASDDQITVCDLTGVAHIKALISSSKVAEAASSKEISFNTLLTTGQYFRLNLGRAP